MQISFNIEKRDHTEFINKVGRGNVSPTLRNFIKSFSRSEDNEEEGVLRKKEAYYKSKMEEWTNKWQEVKTKLDNIDDQRKQDEIKKLEAFQKQKEKEKDIKYRTYQKELHKIAENI